MADRSGSITERDCLEVDRFSTVAQVMTRDMVTLPADTDLASAFDALTGHHLALAPVVEGDRLLGVLTRTGILRSGIYTPSVDAEGRLMIGTAVGINGNVPGRAEHLLHSGSDVLVVDTAHGHQNRMVEALSAVVAARRDRYAERTGKHVPVVAGNVVSADGARDLAEAGADVIKVGVGPGAMCTT